MMLREIWWKAAELKSDVVLIRDGGRQYAGSASTNVNFGSGISSSFSSPVYSRTIAGICLRLNPSKMGVRADNSNMVIDIINESVRQAGIMEGDKVVSINNSSFSIGMPEMLSFLPKQEVKMTVVRPGTGRITGKVVMMENDQSYLQYSDALDWKDQRQQETKCGINSSCQ